jgi:hypothetical protein
MYSIEPTKNQVLAVQTAPKNASHNPCGIEGEICRMLAGAFTSQFCQAF